jgi:hypothetical protein
MNDPKNLLAMEARAPSTTRKVYFWPRQANALETWDGSLRRPTRYRYEL